MSELALASLSRDPAYACSGTHSGGPAALLISTTGR